MGAYEHCPTCLPTLALRVVQDASEERLVPGKIRIFRVNGQSSPEVTTPYEISGTARMRKDYKTLPGKKALGSGMSQTSVTITPKEDGLVEGEETVTLKFLQRDGYRLSLPYEATVKILDNDVAP